MRKARRAALVVLVGLGGLCTAAPPVQGAGPPVVVSADAGADPGVARRVRDVIAGRRAVREDLALPPAESVSPERAAMAERAAGIRLALERARRAESEASWDTCVREAAGALSDAVDVLGRTGDLALLRDLRVQIGACLTLAGSAASARPHFTAAALLDESEPKAGLHREEAERAQAEARSEVRTRALGKVRIETAPPGAEIWIDGHRAAGLSPIEVDVRLGDHFVTARRFRFDAHTELALLQPSGVLRMALDPARREALREQLAAYAGGALAPSPDELRLARAVWSRAEQAVVISPAGGSSCRVGVLDALTGETLRAATVRGSDDAAALLRGVCDALGETCAPPSRGVPWYVWPLAGAAVVGGVISTAFLVNANRDYRFCPAGGCHGP